MKTKLTITTLALLFLSACVSHPEYDITEGVDTTISLFGDKITLPVGSVGPITLGSLLKGTIVEQFLTTDEDGYLSIEAEEELERYNVNDIDNTIPADSKDQPYVYQAGSIYGSVTSIASLLGALGFATPGQVLDIYATSPLSRVSTVSGTVSVTGGTVSYAVNQAFSLELPSRSAEKKLIREFVLEEGQDIPISSITIDDLAFDLPSNVANRIAYSSTRDFVISYKYKSYLAPLPSFSFNLNEFNLSMDLPLAQFDLKHCFISADVESDLPLDVTLSSLVPCDGDGNPIETVKASCNAVITGGSVANPGKSTVTIEVEALEGNIPDIHGLVFSAGTATAQNADGQPVSASQGIRISSSYATLFGGITIPAK